MSSSRRLTPVLLALALGATCLDVVALGFVGGGVAEAQTQRQGSLQLKLRRKPKALEVVLAGVGAKPLLQQRLANGIWEGQLRTQGSPGLMRGPQTLSLPELGIEAVSLSGGGDSYRITVRQALGQSLKDPIVSADGRNLILTFTGLGTPKLQAGQLDLTTPGRVPQSRYAPPLRPRAVAPPLGDMAVGTMVLQNRSYLKLSGPIVPGLNFVDADAKLALKELAKQGGYGFVFSNGGSSSAASEGEFAAGENKISVYLNEVPFAVAFNTVLLASGYQARLQGRTLIVGPSVMGLNMGPTMSKVFRLNQVDAASAKTYLGNLGAKIQVASTSTTTSSENDQDGGGGESSSGQMTTSMAEESMAFGADVGPLVGLRGTTDARLNTITLIGESELISIAEGYLRQIDLRKRQVAVRVQILNVDLNNDRGIDSSFSARLGNTFIVSESGKAFMNFGDHLPGSSDGVGLLGDGTPYTRPGVYDAGIPKVQGQQVFDPPYVEAQKEVTTTTTNSGGTVRTTELVPLLDKFGRPKWVESTDPAANPTLVPKVDGQGRPIYVPGKDPDQFAYPQNSVYGYLEAAIVSSSAKTLAQPTLLVQEGETASVETGTSVITSVTTTDTSNGSSQFTYQRSNAGLTLEVEVDKIDDNGFVTLDLTPEVSVPVPAGRNQGVAIFNISGRKLSSGKIRLRDRQTLVLTGVIQDQDKEEVRKWPVLGDLPFLGQLFRSSVSNRQKSELVILVTPAIVDDEAGGSYGYGYRPSTREARQLMSPR